MRSIRWKVILVTFLVVAIPTFFLNRYTVRSFDRFTSKALEEEMISQAFMLGEQYKAMVLRNDGAATAEREKEFAGILRGYSDRLQSRLQVLSPEGIVLFDSDPDSLAGADFSGREEIANVIEGGGYKAAWRITRNRGHVFYYVPVAIREGGRLAGIAYVSHHTGQITKAIKKMIGDQRLAMVTALGFAAFMAAVVAQTMTRRLRRLTSAAMAYARGNAPLAMTVRGRDEISDLARAVRHMAGEIEKRNAYNRDFISTVTHELKTPVTAIKGAAEVLEQGAANNDSLRAKFLTNIQFEADRLTRMVGELGELTKLDSETLRGQKEKVDYGQCMRQILDRLLPTFDYEHAAFITSIAEESIPVLIVPGRIEQVVSNLLENAFRYTPASGKVTLSVERENKGLVRTVVSDSGRGIQAVHLHRVFDRFFTTEPKNVTKDYGTGLGLAIARSIVENHQGTIRVESEPGRGARFVFTLPVEGR